MPVGETKGGSPWKRRAFDADNAGRGRQSLVSEKERFATRSAPVCSDTVVDRTERHEMWGYRESAERVVCLMGAAMAFRYASRDPKLKTAG
jgi:hypothetical protein